jgi:sugar lactone lactonase YvrE
MRFRLPLAAAAATVVLAGLVAAAPANASTAGAPARGAQAHRHHLPSTYAVPGEQTYPEGSAADERTGTFWVSSLGTGAVYRGHAKDPQMRLFLEPGGDGRVSTVGLEYSRGVLYVAGGESGDVWAYDAYSGKLLTRQSTGAGGFVNDVTIGIDGAAYFTDSFRPYIYRLARTSKGWSLTRWLDVSSVIPFTEGEFNLNGIAPVHRGRYLMVVTMNTGRLYRIDVRTRAITPVRLVNADLANADGLEAYGNSLYVVRNIDNTVVRVRLSHRARVATGVASLRDPSFSTPTTAEVLWGRLLVVNSQFVTETPTLPFTVSAVPLF